MWVNTGKSQTFFVMGGSLTGIGAGSWWIGLGAGSKTIVATTSGLVVGGGSEFDRNRITGSVDVTTLQRLTWQADFDSIEMSGCQLKQVGLFHIGSGGKSWIQDGFANITFDGDEELQIEIIGKVY